MFTGIGGFELGLGERFECIGFSENDKFCSKLLSKKFPTIKNYGDATKINPNKLPNFDMLCGGFPCQTFSIAGKRRGLEDTRGTLFFNVARIVKVKRPKIVFLENVKGLLNHNKGKTFSIILTTLSKLGYDVQWMVLNSKFFGVPQNRERVFIIGNLRGQPKPKILPFRETNKEIYKLQIKEIGTVKNSIALGTNSRSRVYDVKGIVGAVASTDYKQAKQIYVNGKLRRLTPLEYEMIQGFPHGYTVGFSDTQRYKMLGNAVTVNVIKEIGKKLQQFL